MHRTCAILLLLAFTLPVSADSKILAPFLDDRTVAVAHLDLGRLDSDVLLARAAQMSRVEVKDLAELDRWLQGWLPALVKAGAREAFVVFSLADLPERPFFVVVPAPADAANPIAAALEKSAIIHEGRAEATGPAVVYAHPATRRRLASLKPMTPPGLSDALAVADATAPLRIAFFASDDTRRVFEEVLPELPRELGGGPIKSLTRGLVWASVAVETTPKLALQVRLQSSDKPSAGALSGTVAGMLKGIATQKVVRDFLPQIATLTEALVPRVEDDHLTLTADEKALVTSLAPAGVWLRHRAERERTKANLHRIGRAIYYHHDRHGKFPAAYSTDAKGKPLLSWRVHVLPFLGEAELYREFKLDEPWDSEHNKKLVARMPAVYRSPAQRTAPGTTTYLVPVGEDTIFPGAMALRFSDIADGSSNTILVLEASDAHAVEWTRPADWKLNPKKPRDGLVGHYPGGFLMVLADGMVAFVPERVMDDVLLTLFTRNDGQVIPPDAFEVD